MDCNPYLVFDGSCAEAFAAYARILDGEIDFVQTHAQVPGNTVPPEWGDKIMHAQLRFGSNVLMGSDSPPDWYEKPAGISVALHLADADVGRRVFDALAEGGTVRLEFQETPWAAGFGMLTDRFGIPWMVNGGSKS
jgi:PhnB protein